MDKEIYRLFTLENGIIISKPVLCHLSGYIKTQNDLSVFFKTFKTKYNTSFLSIDQVDKIFSNNDNAANGFAINSFRFKHRHFPTEYEFFKSRINAKITSISLLPIDCSATIFGILYKNKKGKYVLEDELDIIEINFSNVSNDSFLFENMFLAISGIKKIIEDSQKNEKIIFEAVKIILPQNIINSSKNDFLDKSKKKILFFGCYKNEKDFVNQILQKENPDIAIISCDAVIDLNIFENCKQQILVCSCKCDKSFLPSQVKSISNPFVLELCNSKIGFIDHNLFKLRENGLFLNKNPLDSFLKSYISQSSLNPFSSADLLVNEVPNIIIISQNTYPQVIDIDSVKIYSLPPISQGLYAVVDFNSIKFEIRS